MTDAADSNDKSGVTVEIFGYLFKNPALLDEALTTPSCRMENPSVRDNQRPEFLGDAVIGLLAADALYASCPGAPEGELTVKRTQMVSTGALCAAARRLDLAARLHLNRGAAPLPASSKTLADAVEAVIGAAWLDGGLAAARQVFDALMLADDADAGVASNPKGDLQIWAQALTPPRLPVYTCVGVAGKVHAPVFTMRVSVDGAGEAQARASSRREAEALAAARLLARLTSTR
jgi:ribonuclease-3